MISWQCAMTHFTILFSQLLAILWVSQNWKMYLLILGDGKQVEELSEHSFSDGNLFGTYNKLPIS